MKRKKIASLMEEAGKMMDQFKRVEVKDKRTGEIAGTIPEGEIGAMQTALVFCVHMLKDLYEPRDAMELIAEMIKIHGAVMFDLDEEDGDDD